MSRVLVTLALILTVTPALAGEGPSQEVPKGHWAYEAVNQLKKAGILVGYPKAAFEGKRILSREEFAAAIARMIPTIHRAAADTSVTRQELEDLDRRISALEKGEVAPPSKAAPVPPDTPTKAEVDALRKLVDEFSTELKRMRVDVDALKKDVAALNDRVTKVQKQEKRQILQ